MANRQNDLEYPSEATLGDQWLRGSRLEWQKLLVDSPRSALAYRERVSRLAYQLYLRRGKVQGHDLEDWLTAERIVLSQLAQSEKPIGDGPNGEKGQ